MRFKKNRIYLCIYFLLCSKTRISFVFIFFLFILCMSVCTRIHWHGSYRFYCFYLSHKYFVLVFVYCSEFDNATKLMLFMSLCAFIAVFLSIVQHQHKIHFVSFFADWFGNKFFFFSIINNIHFICVISLKQLRRSFVTEDWFNV